MPEYGQPSGASRDPARIVYHAENRTFARLFQERSLDEVKDVVRRKLSLGRETDVSLKQMGFDPFLDLEDDDDFQAFRVLLRSSVSVDIQVIVGVSRGSALPPLVASKYREQPSVVIEPTATPSASSRSEVLQNTRVSTTAVKTPGRTRKRKVSFDDATLAESVERRAPKRATVPTPAPPLETVDAPAPAPVVEEPPKKRQKKEAIKAKDVQPPEAGQSSPVEASVAPKSRAKKSATESKVGASMPKDTGALELSGGVQKKRTKDGDMGWEESSAHIDQSIDQSDDPANEAPLQSVSKKPRKTSVTGGASRTRKSSKLKEPGVCATIPQTNASASVQSEVAAAILLSSQAIASGIVPSVPPAKGGSVKKGTKRSSASSGALSMEFATELGASADEIPDVPTEPEHAVLNGLPQQTPDLNSPPCPICLKEPFHIRYYCPVVLKGPDAIRERLEELKRMNTGDQQTLIKELEGLLCDSKVTSKSSSDAAQTDGIQLRGPISPPSVSLPRTPTIPSNSYMSEVTVESREEGSSSESSDGMSEGEVDHINLPIPQRQRTSDEQPSPANDDLDAVIHGPGPKHQSVLHVIDRIVEDDDEDSELVESEAELEEDTDEEIGRSKHRLSKHISPSDSEGRDEESTSPPPSRLGDGSSKNLQPGIQGSDKPTEESTEHEDGATVTKKNSVDPPVLERREDESSEETHVGSEDRMDTDHGQIGEKRSDTIKQQSSIPAARASVLSPSDAFSNEPKKNGFASSRDGGVQVTSAAHNEVETDPIEPADDLAAPATSHPSDADPIEVPEDTGSLFAGVTQSTPKPGASKRIKIRDSRKTVETTVSQEPALTGKPSTSTPAAVSLLNQRSKDNSHIGKFAKTLAKRPGARLDPSQSSTGDDVTQHGGHIAPTPSLIRWETLAESPSPSLQLHESSVLIDELMSSSPQPNSIPKGRSRKAVSSRWAEGTQGKERLSSSQVPLPNSQNQSNLAPTALPNGKEREETTDSGLRPKTSKKNARPPSAYRPLSNLASSGTAFFSPSLPTPANKSMTGGEIKKSIVDEDSSSSSSDESEVSGSEHIPQGRRAGSVMETKKKRKSLLSWT